MRGDIYYPCSFLNTTEEFNTCYYGRFQQSLDESKPWIGMYITLASAVCGIAMALDVFNGFKTKNLWFPCKYFSLNSTSLTLLSVAMKLTMDLTSTKLNNIDTYAGYSSFGLMSAAMSNLMTSIANMDDNDIILNLTAIGILVITIFINQWIFVVQTMRIQSRFVLFYDNYASIILLLLLIFLCASAIIVPTTKIYLETKFFEMHKRVLSERVNGEKITAQKLSVILRQYWIMAATGNPQFVLSRSVICVIPSVFCLLMTLALLIVIGKIAPIIINEKGKINGHESVSTYKWSSRCIIIVQTVVAVIGTIAPASRLFAATKFRRGRINLKKELKTEKYWTQSLVRWKKSPLCIQRYKIKKILYISREVLLSICIKIQIVIVVISKRILIIFSWFINVAFKFINVFKFKSDSGGLDPIGAGMSESDFSPYVMLLEGESELPNKIIANIFNDADKLVQVGKMQKPEMIHELLQESTNFNGIRGFDRKKLPSLHVQEPRTSWSISLVTLTSIAVALPNISSNKLFSSVNEGFPFVKLIEKHFDSNGEMRTIKKTVDNIWEKVKSDQKLKDQKLKEKNGVQENNINDQTHKDILHELSTEAEKTIVSFNEITTDSVMKNPINWPIEIIAANSMYMVCKNLLLVENDATTPQFFKQLTIIISDILAACLTNLAHVLFKGCYISSIEKRQESIRRSLIRFGECEEIIQCLEQREWPNLDPDKAGYIEEWQAIIESGIEIPVNSVSTTADSSTPPTLQSSSGEVT